jgi:DNA-binding NarL/FixJ family response regulator
VAIRVLIADDQEMVRAGFRAITAAVASEANAVDVLTERELDVVELVARGKTNAEIAEALFVSVSTVKTHLEAVRAKLGVRNRVGIAAWAWEHGVVG